MSAARRPLAIASGRRAAYMALRLKYAGLEPTGNGATSGNGASSLRAQYAAILLDGDVRRAAEQALAATPPGGRLYVLPTYTAMLEVRELLAALAGRQHFWDQ